MSQRIEKFQKEMMKRTILLFSALFLAVLTQAQDQKEVKINKNGGKYEVTIEKEVNGKKSVVNRTYSSREEMMNDPELKDMNIFVMPPPPPGKVMKIESKDGEKSYEFKMKSDGEEGEEMTFDVIVEGLDGEEGHEFMTKGNVMIFKADGVEGSFGMHNQFDITTDEDGTVHVTKDGKEIEGDTWVDDEGKEYKIKRSEGKVIITSGDGNFEWIGDDDVHFDISTDVEVDGDHNVMIFKSEDGEVKEWTNDEGQNIKIKKIIKEGEEGEHQIIMLDGNGEHKDVQVFVKKMEDGSENMKVTLKIIEKINLHIEELESGDFAVLMEAKSKKLKVEDVNYYPNPSAGKFSLQFKAPAKPTSVKVLSLEGKEIYSEELSGFEGSYENEIDLTDQKRGIYLLRVQQGSRTINKKIVIE